MIADLNQVSNQQQHEEELFTVQPSFLAMNMDSFQSYSDKISQALEESSQFTSFLNFEDVNSNNYESYSRSNNTQFEELGREIASRIQQQAMIIPTDTTSFDLHTIEEDALNEEDISVEKQQFSRKVSCLISAQENEQNEIKHDNDQRGQAESEYHDDSHPQTTLLQDEEHNPTQVANLIASNNAQSEEIYKDVQNTSDKEKQKNITQMKINLLAQKQSKESSQDNYEQARVDKYSKTTQADQAKKENGGENATNAKIQIDEERVLREKVNNHRTKDDLLAQQWEQKDLSLAHFLAIRKQESQTNFKIFDQGKEAGNVQKASKPKGQVSSSSAQTQDQQLKQQNARVSYNLMNSHSDSAYQQLNNQPGTTGMMQQQLSPQMLSQIKSQSLHIIQHTNTANYPPGASYNEVSSKVLNKSSRNDNQSNQKSQHYFASSHPLNSKTSNNPQLKQDSSQGKCLEAKYLRLQELQKEKLKEEKAKYQKALKDQQDEKIFLKTNRPFHNNFTNQVTCSSQTSNETNKIGNRNNKSSNNEKNEYYLNYLITQQGGSNSNNNTNSSMNSAQFEDLQGNGYLNSYKMKKKQLSLSNLSSKTVPLSPSSKIKQSSGSIYQLSSQVSRKIEPDQIGSKSPNQKQSQQPLDLNVIKKITFELSSSEQRKNKEKQAMEIAKAERQAKMLVQSGQVAEAINKMLFQTNFRNQTSPNRKPKQHGTASRLKAHNATPVIVVEQHEERQTKQQHFQNIDNLLTGYLFDSIPQRHQQVPNQRGVMQQLDALRKEQVELGQKIIAKQTRPKSGRPSTTSAQITHSELRDHLGKVQSFTQRTQQKEKNNGQAIQKNGQGLQNSRSNYIQLKTLLL